MSSATRSISEILQLFDIKIVCLKKNYASNFNFDQRNATFSQRGFKKDLKRTEKLTAEVAGCELIASHRASAHSRMRFHDHPRSIAVDARHECAVNRRDETVLQLASNLTKVPDVPFHVVSEPVESILR